VKFSGDRVRGSFFPTIDQHRSPPHDDNDHEEAVHIDLLRIQAACLHKRLRTLSGMLCTMKVEFPQLEQVPSLFCNAPLRPRQKKQMRFEGLFRQFRGLAGGLSVQWPGFSSEDGLQLAQKLSKWDEA
jgi:hypothetical protein